jgi:hypothetical protein
MGAAMPRRKKSESKEKTVQYVSIAQASDKPLAEDCAHLLKDNEIEAIVEELKRNTYIVKVDEGRFNEAYIIIQSHLTPEGFFDMHTETMQIKDPTQAA